MDNYSHIEPAIRNVVEDLNIHFQKTIMSCQGHVYGGETYGGWISFVANKRFSKDASKGIMEQHGLKNICFLDYADKPGVHFAHFDRVI